MTKSITNLIHFVTTSPILRSFLVNDEDPYDWLNFNQMPTQRLLQCFPWPSVMQHRAATMQNMDLKYVIEESKSVDLVSWFYRAYWEPREITLEHVELLFSHGMLNPLIRQIHAEGKLPDGMCAVDMIKQIGGTLQHDRSCMNGEIAVESCRFLLEELGLPLSLRDQFDLVTHSRGNNFGHYNYILNYLICERRQAVFPLRHAIDLLCSGAYRAAMYCMKEVYVPRFGGAYSAQSNNRICFNCKLENEQEAYMFLEMFKYVCSHECTVPLQSVQIGTITIDSMFKMLHIFRPTLESLLYTNSHQYDSFAKNVLQAAIQHNDMPLCELALSFAFASRGAMGFKDLYFNILRKHCQNRQVIRMCWEYLAFDNFECTCAADCFALGPYVNREITRKMAWDAYELSLQYGQWSVAMLEEMHTKHRLVPKIEHILASGHLDAVQWMYDRGFVEAEDATYVFISTNNADITKYTYQQSVKSSSSSEAMVFVWGFAIGNDYSYIKDLRTWKEVDDHELSEYVARFMRACQDHQEARKSLAFILDTPQGHTMMMERVMPLLHGADLARQIGQYSLHHLYTHVFFNCYATFKEIFAHRPEIWPPCNTYETRTVRTWPKHVAHLDAVLNGIWKEDDEDMKKVVVSMFEDYCAVGVNLKAIQYLLNRFPSFLSLDIPDLVVADNVRDALMT